LAKRGRPKRKGDAGEEPDRRTQIVAAAVRVLAREGFENTSLKQIAAEAGIATALIHYYFKNKEELLVAVVRHLDDFFREAWHSRIGDVRDPMERLMVSVESIAEMMRRHPEFWRLQFQLFMLSQSNPALRPATGEMVETFLSNLAAEARELSDMLPATPLQTLSIEDQATLPAAVIYGIGWLWMLTGKDPLPMLRLYLLLLMSGVALTNMMSGRDPGLDRVLELVQRFSDPETYRGPKVE
jgi:AcrR family transcriptional regulator